MQGPTDRFSAFLVSERARHIRRLRLAGVIAVLIVVLIYQTQWLMLRPGLAILLAGQLGVVVALLWRNAKLLKDLDSGKRDVLEENAVLAWFQSEERFMRRLMLFESGCQMIGFGALGYGFWMVTRSLWLAIAIGVVYPVSSYLGVTRRRSRDTIRKLRTEKQEVVLSRLRPWRESIN